MVAAVEPKGAVQALTRRALLAGGLSAASGLRASPGTTLTVAAFPLVDDMARAAIPSWQRLHPDVAIQVVSRQYADHHTAMITALSTSALLPSTFTAECTGRERTIVVHPINPPFLIPACEVVPAPWTDERTLRETVDLIRSIGQVPIPMTVFQGSAGTAASGPPTRSFNYQNIGTTIAASATQTDDRFRVTLTVDDSSVVPAKDPDGFVTLKSLKTSNLLLLTDGQRADFLAATDKVTGEVTRIVVTVTVLK